MQLSLQLSKLQGTTSYFDGNMGKVGVKSDTVHENQAQIWQGLDSTNMITTFSIQKVTVHLNMLHSVHGLVRTRQ
jgi:hypothetical protein